MAIEVFVRRVRYSRTYWWVNMRVDGVHYLVGEFTPRVYAHKIGEDIRRTYASRGPLATIKEFKGLSHRELLLKQVEKDNEKGAHLLPDGRWRSDIYVNRRRICLGYYSTEGEAHQAYVKARSEVPFHRYVYDPHAGTIRLKLEPGEWLIKGTKAKPDFVTEPPVYQGAPLPLRALAWALYHGRMPKNIPIPLDGDPDNLRLSNLYLPYSVRRNNTSGSTGVSKDGKRWRAYIYKDGRQVHLGRFPTKDLATAARIEALSPTPTPSFL